MKYLLYATAILTALKVSSLVNMPWLVVLLPAFLPLLLVSVAILATGLSIILSEISRLL
jgi:hypothetical protein